MNRREKANKKYQQLFYEHGLDRWFDYIAFESKDHIRLRCKCCKVEQVKSKDAFIGRQSRLLCSACQNGRLLFSDEVNEVLAYYSSGHSTQETCKKFGISKSRLQDWVKRRKVSNGRTFEEGGRESNKKRAEQATHLSRNKSHYARAKVRGAPAEIGITIHKLIKRDGLNCALCGLPCYPGGDYQADLYPTIDHIIPISKGGGHTWDNVQVVHRRCNLNKGSSVGREWKNAS